MSSLLAADQIIAIAIADLHLWETPPPAREGEPEWFAAMSRPLEELRAFWFKHDKPPVIIAGDIFDRWNPSPKAISFAMNELPHGSYAVPGQHDLRYHSYESNLEESGYWTLVTAGTLQHLEYDLPRMVSTDLMLWGFPWGCKPISCDRSQLGKIAKTAKQIAVVHGYCWASKYSNPAQADEATNVTQWTRKLMGYDFLVFGDNHTGFSYKGEAQTIINCGSMMRRRTNDFNLKPSFWLLWGDGRATNIEFDTSQESLSKKVDDEKEIAGTLQDLGIVDGIDDMIKEIQTARDRGVDFLDALKKVATRKDFPRLVTQILVNAIEAARQ